MGIRPLRMYPDDHYCAFYPQNCQLQILPYNCLGHCRGVNQRAAISLSGTGPTRETPMHIVREQVQFLDDEAMKAANNFKLVSAFICHEADNCPQNS
jgi:uncharacterized protein YuzB (UPF0349 family)